MAFFIYGVGMELNTIAHLYDKSYQKLIGDV